MPAALVQASVPSFFQNGSGSLLPAVPTQAGVSRQSLIAVPAV